MTRLWLFVAFLFLIASFLVGCQGARISSVKSNEKQVEDLIRRGAEALNEKDYRTMYEMMSPNYRKKASYEQFQQYMAAAMGLALLFTGPGKWDVSDINIRIEGDLAFARYKIRKAGEVLFRVPEDTGNEDIYRKVGGKWYDVAEDTMSPGYNEDDLLPSTSGKQHPRETARSKVLQVKGAYIESPESKDFVAVAHEFWREGYEKYGVYGVIGTARNVSDEWFWIDFALTWKDASGKVVEVAGYPLTLASLSPVSYLGPSQTQALVFPLIPSSMIDRISSYELRVEEFTISRLREFDPGAQSRSLLPGFYRHKSGDKAKLFVLYEGVEEVYARSRYETTRGVNVSVSILNTGDNPISGRVVLRWLGSSGNQIGGTETEDFGPLKPRYDDTVEFYLSLSGAEKPSSYEFWFEIAETGRTIAWGKKVSPEFKAKAIEVSERLQIDADHLMAVMAFETGKTFDPAVTNPVSGAVGLIQFLPSTARSLGTTVEELRRMRAVEQLDYVEKYFLPHRGKLTTLEDVYMAVLWPKAIGQPNDYILFAKPSTAYDQNRGLDLNGDGRVTKGEASAKGQDSLAKGLQLGNVGRFLGRGQEEARRAEFHDVSTAVTALMTENNLPSIPAPVTANTSPCTTGTQAMTAYPDTTSSSTVPVGSPGKVNAPNGTAYTFPGDKAGYLIYGHDITADAAASPTVNYVNFNKTTYCYTIDANGTVHQYNTAGAEQLQ